MVCRESVLESVREFASMCTRFTKRFYCIFETLDKHVIYINDGNGLWSSYNHCHKNIKPYTSDYGSEKNPNELDIYDGSENKKISKHYIFIPLQK